MASQSQETLISIAPAHPPSSRVGLEVHASLVQEQEHAIQQSMAPANLQSPLSAIGGTSEEDSKNVRDVVVAADRTPGPAERRLSAGNAQCVLDQDTCAEAQSSSTPCFGSRGRQSFAEWTRVSGLENLSPILEADSLDHSLCPDLADSNAAQAVDGKENISVRCPTTARSHAPVADNVLTNASEDGSNMEGGNGAPLNMEDEEQTDLSLQSTEKPVAEIPAKKVLVNGVSYVRLKTLGRGGSSKVYEVKGPSGEIFALKRVLANGSAHFNDLVEEVTLLQQLKDCPHVIQVIDAEVRQHHSSIHIVLERGDMDLAQFLQTQDLSIGDVQAGLASDVGGSSSCP